MVDINLFVNIFIQLTYFLDVSYNYIEFMYLDLHKKNILILEQKQEKVIVIVLDEKIKFEFKSKIILKLCDFGLSFIKGGNTKAPNYSPIEQFKDIKCSW
jgi:hypothetical protein